MRKKLSLAAVCAALCLIAIPAQAAKDQKCRVVTGKALWSLIPAPNDTLGRVLGPTTGDLKAAVSAYLTDLQFAGGVFHATSVETWVLGPTDMLVFTGDAMFTPISSSNVDDKLTLTVSFGTGAFEGASGVIEVRGTGYNFLPGPALGSTYFDVSYSGNICTVK